MRSGAIGVSGQIDTPGLWAHEWTATTSHSVSFSGSIDLYFAESGVYTTSGNLSRWIGLPLRCLVR